MIVGPRNSLSDVAGLRVGHAQDAALKSGTTVVVADAPFTASCHVMGGAPGTRETDLLAPDKTVAGVDALVLSGGSAFGLDACGGVADGLRAQGRGFAIGDVTVPIVPGAIIFDLINGGDKAWTETPYPALGRAALEDAREAFAIGSVGAGTGALAGGQKGGIGSASFTLATGHTVAALMVVNPIGNVTTPERRHFWAAPYEQGDEFGGKGVDPRSGLGALSASRKSIAMQLAPADRGNTTIGIVATDAPLSKAQCHRMATAAHDGIARAIVPAHSPYDGDMLFGISTCNDAPVSDDALLLIGHGAAVCVSRAIARGVYAATPAEGDILPCWPD